MRYAASSVWLFFVAGFLLSLPSEAQARGGWGEIQTVYCYEADEGQDAYVSADNTIGCLDGQWRRSNNSDEWDGSTPEPGVGAPGGVVVQTLADEGEDGGDASVLDIEDVSASGSGDLNTRKIFLWRNTTAELDLSRGVTMVSRWRLNPEPLSSEFVNNGGSIPVPDGYGVHSHGKGQIGFAQKTAVGGTGIGIISFAINDAGLLQFNIDGDNPACAGTWPSFNCIDVDEQGWVSIWMAVQETAGGVEMRIYLNGELDPVLDTAGTPMVLLSTSSFDDVTLPEGVGSASSYIIMAEGNSGQTGAIQIDYLCVADGFLEPSASQPDCPAGARAQADAKNVVLSWTNGSKVPTGVDVYRDGATIATAAPAVPPSYTDLDVPPGSHSYELRFSVTGETCEPLTASVHTCPGGLVLQAHPQGVFLRWTNVAEYPGLSVSRDGTEIASLAGNVTEYLDQEAPTGNLTYELEPTAGTCDPLTATIDYIAVDIQPGDFSGTNVEWTYALDPPADADPEEYLVNVTGTAVGDLDGTWSSGNGSDSWDGSAPGEIGDPTLDAAGIENDPLTAAPGGIGLVADGDVGAYLFEDVGDPTVAVPPNTVGWQDPSNRKLYLAHDMQMELDDSTIRSLITDGLTLRARLRLTSSERAVDVTDAPNGYTTQNDGKGMVVIDHDAGVTASGSMSQRIGLALDVNPGLPGTGILYIGDVGALNSDGTKSTTEIVLAVPDPTQWLDIWLTVEDPDPLTPEVNLTLYFNGSTEPAFFTEGFVPHDEGSEGGMAAAAGNSLYIGLNATPDSGSMELDLVAYADGVYAPESGPPVTLFRRGDADAKGGAPNITDGIFVLNYLFLGGVEPPCREAANADDTGDLNITDGIYILNYLFLGGPAPPAPGPDTCGPEPADSKDHVGCKEYKTCATP